MRYLSLFLFVGFFSGCVSLPEDVNYICVKSGVKYVETASGLAVMVDKDNKPIGCVYEEPVGQPVGKGY